jgi:hypothetical protein
MTYSPATATGNGVNTDFSFTFPYLNQLHVKATINSVPTTAFTFFAANILRFTVAPANGAAVVISRETPSDELNTIIQPGSSIPVDGLNDNFYQALYVAQETEFSAANQSTAGLQAQIDGAIITANSAVATAGAAQVIAENAEDTANAIAGTAATASSNASAAVVTANAASAAVATALLKTGGTMTGQIAFAAGQVHSPPVIFVQDQKTSGTNGGSFTSGAWRVRDLNTQVSNSITGASLSGNQITLPPGTYSVDAFATATDVLRHRIRLQNISGSTVSVYGPSITASIASSNCTPAILKAAFTLASTTVLELQHRCETTNASAEGRGYATNWATEIYASVQIVKLA